MELFDFGAFQNFMQMLSHDRIIFHMIFWAIRVTSRIILGNFNLTIKKPSYNVHRFQTAAPSGPRFGGAFGRVAVAAGNFIRRFLRPPTAVQRPLLRFMRPRRLQPVATKFMVDPAQVNSRL